MRLKQLDQLFTILGFVMVSLAIPIIPVLESEDPTTTTTTIRPILTPRSRGAQVDASVDTNGDGVLDVDEVRYAAFVHHGLSASVVEDMFKQVDANKDSVLDAHEFDAIRTLVLDKAENAALRYLQNVDSDRDGLLSVQEAQRYLLKEYGIGYRDTLRLWKLVTPTLADRLNATMFSKLRRRVRGMNIRLARQIMKTADVNGDAHISIDEAQAIAFEQEGIGAGDVVSMVGSVDENMDGELNAPEFADFERIIRARALENSKKAMRVVDADNSGTLTLDEAKRVAFEHYGFDENTLSPFFGQADENEDAQLDTVEFAGFRSVIRARSVKDAMEKFKRIDADGDGLISGEEAVESTKSEDDMDREETMALFNIADQNKSGKLDRVELADFNRLVRLSSIKFATDHFKEFDLDANDAVSFEEIALLIEQKYGIPRDVIKTFFDRIDVDHSEDLSPAEIVDFRHLIRHHVAQKRQPITTTTTTTTTTVTTVTINENEDSEMLVTVTPSVANDVIAQDIVASAGGKLKMQKIIGTQALTTVAPITSTTRIPRVITTTTIAPTTTDGVLVEEVVYEDENGNRMQPKGKTAKNQDVSYEEVIEYVDESGPSK